MVSKRTELCQQMIELSDLIDGVERQLDSMIKFSYDITHYSNVFGKQAEWQHKIDIKQRAYARLLQRFNNIKQQLQ
jgi:phage-related protein